LNNGNHHATVCTEKTLSSGNKEIMNTFVIASIKGNRPLQVRKRGQGADEVSSFTDGTLFLMEHGAMEYTYALARDEGSVKTYEEAEAKALALKTKLESLSPELLEEFSEEEDRELYRRRDSLIAVKTPQVVILALNIQEGKLVGQPQVIFQENTSEGLVWELKNLTPNQMVAPDKLLQEIEQLTLPKSAPAPAPTPAPAASGISGFFSRLIGQGPAQPAAATETPSNR
jgi:hypothetical protein